MFSIEGKFFRTLTKIGDFLILGVLGIIFSIPVITVGASLAAMSSVGMKLVKDEEGYVFRNFLHSWKSNFKQSVGVELILAVIGIILCTDVSICVNWAREEGSLLPQILIYAFFGLILVLIAVVIYAFPLLSKFENTVVGTIKNAMLLCMKHLPQTFIMLICTVGLSYFSLGYFPVFVLTIPIMCYVNSYIMTRIFKPYEAPQEDDGKKAEDDGSKAEDDGKKVEDDGKKAENGAGETEDGNEETKKNVEENVE